MYNSFQEYLKENPDGDFDDYESSNFRSKTKSMQAEDGFVDAITFLASDLKFSDEELAERFNVSLSTFKQWRYSPFPYFDVQKQVVLFLNSAKLGITICNQCDKKKISSEICDLTCNKCLGKE